MIYISLTLREQNDGYDEVYVYKQLLLPQYSKLSQYQVTQNLLFKKKIDMALMTFRIFSRMFRFFSVKEVKQLM
jgi:hypothetical protein